MPQPLGADVTARFGPPSSYTPPHLAEKILTSKGVLEGERKQVTVKVYEHVPGSQFHRVAAAGHSTYFEQPDVFNREVGAFLKAHRP